jgi:putative hydrolase of the HAD superfamily
LPPKAIIRPARKLHNSGLGHYFHHIEVMSDKQVDYSDLIKRLEIQPEEFS